MLLPLKLNTFNQALLTGEEDSSVHDYLLRTVGDSVSKVITLDANNTAASVNIFQLTGTCEVFRLFGVVTTATTMTNCTGVHFELYDSDAAVDLTRNDGVLSGLPVGTWFAKNAAAASTMAVNSAAAGALTEAATNKFFDQFVVTQKTGADTFIRLTYATTDEPIAATLTICAEYQAVCASSTLTAV